MKKYILLLFVFFVFINISQAQLYKSITAREAYDTLVAQKKLEGKEIMTIYTSKDTSAGNENQIDLKKGTAYYWFFITKATDPNDTKAYFYIVQVFLNIGIVTDFDDDSDDYSVYPVLGKDWLNSDKICQSIPLDGDFYAFYIPNKDKITNVALSLMPTNMGTPENPDLMLDTWTVSAAVSDVNYVTCIYNANTGESLYCEEHNETSVPTQTTKPTMFLYPNPTTGLIKLNAPIYGSAIIQIINNLGEIIFNENVDFNGNYQLNLSNFSNGLYTVKITTKDNIYLKKVILYK